MIKKILPTLLLVIFAQSLLAQADTRISATWQVLKYDMNVTLPANDSTRTISVKALLELKNVSRGAASSLTLRISPNADVTSVKVGGNAVNFTKGQEKAGNVDLQRIASRLTSVPTGENITAEVDYTYRVADNSGLSSISASGLQFLPQSHWYPTPNSWFFARGADYAPFNISVNAPSGQRYLTAGTLTNGKFENKLNGQPFFTVGSWLEVERNGVQLFLPQNAGETGMQRAEEISQLANEAAMFASNLLGPQPDSPLRVIAVRRGGGFTNGRTILLEDGVFRRRQLDSMTALVVTEAVVKGWLGDAALLTDDGDGVIREGLTRYIATRFLEHKYGKEVAETERLRQMNAYSSVSRRDSPLTLAVPVDDFYYTAVANKGAMVWRLLTNRVGEADFFTKIRELLPAGRVTLAQVRAAFPEQKAFLNNMFDQVTDINLIIGLPQETPEGFKVALRNTGNVDVTVNVEATLADGKIMTVPATLKATSFSDIIFKADSKITRVEIDPEKLFPQTDYSDDVSPRESTESDPLLFVKREFDKREFAAAETNARVVLRDRPKFDDVRILLARSLLAQNKLNEADTEFRNILSETLPAARNAAWALVGLADIAVRNGQNAQAVSLIDEVIRYEADYGAVIAARELRKRTNPSQNVPEDIKQFFTRFDAAATANRKADLEAMLMPGEASRFINGIAGQTVSWATQPLYADTLGQDIILIEANVNVRLLNRETETGTAVYRFYRAPQGWRLMAVDSFEVR